MMAEKSILWNHFGSEWYMSKKKKGMAIWHNTKHMEMG